MNTIQQNGDLWSGKLKILMRNSTTCQVYIPKFKLTLDIQIGEKGKEDIHICGWKKGHLIFTFSRFGRRVNH